MCAAPDWSERWANSSGKADMTPRSLFAMAEWAIRSPPPCPRPSPTSRTLRDACTGLARDAAREIMRIYAGDLGERTKADKSPVTDADHAAEAIIVAGLRTLTPDLAVVAEEEMAAGHVPKLDGRPFWLVDPLDGTKEFIKRNGEFTVNIALIEDGQADARHRARAGARHAVARRRRAWAPTRARTAAPSRRSAVRTPPAAGLTACASRSTAIYSDLDIWFRNNGLTVAERKQAGSSLKFCLIAEGKADIYPRFGPTNEWDTAAGQGVLEAAGGEVVTTDGRPLALRQAGLRQSALHRPQQGRAMTSSSRLRVDRRGRAAASGRASSSPSRPRRSTAWAPTPPTSARSRRSSRPRAGRSSIR